MNSNHSSHPGASTLVQAAQMYLPALDHVAEMLSRRRIRRNYGRMTDAQLRDVGLIPHDVVAALALPLTQSAGDALARAAANEAARW